MGRSVKENVSVKKVALVLVVVAALIGGGLSLFASANPDGLEWSIQKVTGSTELDRSNNVSKTLESVQESTAFLPDYAFKSDAENTAGTSVSGIVGSAITLGLAALIGFGASKVKKTSDNNTTNTMYNIVIISFATGFMPCIILFCFPKSSILFNLYIDSLKLCI